MDILKSTMSQLDTCTSTVGTIPTAVTAGLPGRKGSHFYRGSGGFGDSCLEISIDYRGKTAVVTASMGTI